MGLSRSRAEGGLLALVLATVPCSLPACSLLTSLDGLSGGGDGGATGQSGPFGLSDDASTGGGGDPDASTGDGGPGTPTKTNDAATKDGSDGSAASSDGGGDAGGPLTCPDGGIPCKGACVDPTDPANCNGCGVVCGSGLCGTTIDAPMTSAPSGWSFNGSAQFNSYAPSAELTVGGALGQAGTVLYEDPVAVDTMVVSFQFRIGVQGSTRSDGMGFVLEQTGPTAVGGNGAGLGMAGLSGYGVELDIYDNAICGDTSDDHVGVDQLAVCDQSEGTPASLYELDITSVLDLADTHWHSAQIDVQSGAVTLTIDGAKLFSNVALQGWQSGEPYYLGFSGGTGGLVASDGGGGFRQEVKNVVITFPTPRCL